MFSVTTVQSRQTFLAVGAVSPRRGPLYGGPEVYPDSGPDTHPPSGPTSALMIRHESVVGPDIRSGTDGPKCTLRERASHTFSD